MMMRRLLLVVSCGGAVAFSLLPPGDTDSLKAKYYDLNDDGKLEPKEIENAQADIEESQDREEDQFESRDTNVDDCLSLEEFMAVEADRLNLLDHNDDCFLSEEELTSIYTRDLQVLKKADTDEDGYITEEDVAVQLATGAVCMTCAYGKYAHFEGSLNLDEVEEDMATTVERQKRTYWVKLDGDGDGVITCDEFLAHHQLRFKMLDLDAGDCIDRDEVAAEADARKKAMTAVG